MSALTINVLGRVEIRRDGDPVRLFHQQAVALAVLVAARGQQVPRDTLIQAIWPDPDQVPVHDGLAPVISRLRASLAGGGVDIPAARPSGHYRLVGTDGSGLDEVVDAFRFEAGRREGSELLAAGLEAEALERFRAAADEWAGPPLETGREWPEPWLCDRFRAELERERVYLLRHVAEIALRRGGRYADAAFLRGHPVSAAARVDAVWLIALLGTLRDEGVTAARRAIGSRRRSRGPAEVVDRASDLVMLHQANIDVHRPLRGRPGRPVTGSPPEMVGREAESGSLRAFLALVRDGHPATLTVRGPAGVGKTRLVEEFAALAADGGVPLVTLGRRGPGALQPWRDLVGALWANSRRDIANGPDPLSPAQRQALTDFVTGHGGGPGTDPARQRDLAGLALGLRVLLLQACKPRGLVVVFDDAERLTERGYELLAEIRSGLAGAAIGWLLVGRDTGHWPDLPEPSRGESRPVLQLRPLTTDGVRHWLGLVWPREPTDEETERLWQRTRGLPVHLCEIGGPDDAGSLPPDEPARWRAGPSLPWLAAAAITAMDLDIDTALVAEMLGLGDDEADRQQAAAAALRRIETVSGVRFRHDKWRAMVISELDGDPALRRRLHRRAFEALGKRMRGFPGSDPTLPVRIAEHARAADRDLPEPDVARAFLAAARAEQASFSSGAAAGWARAGLRLRCAAEDRFDLLMTLGDALNDGGSMHDAGVQYLTAYELAAGRPKAQAAAAISLARRWSDPGQSDQDLLHVLRASLAGLAGEPGEAEALRLQLTAHIAHKSTMAVPEAARGAPGDGPALARQALAGLRPDLPPAVRCEVLDECRMGLYDAAPPAETLTISRRLLEASSLARSGYFRSEALVALAIDQLRLGQIAQAQATIAQHRRHIAQNHRPLGSWLQATLDTVVDLWHGRFDAAERRLFGESRQAVAQARAGRGVPADTLLQTWHGQVYWLLRERGRTRELFELNMAEDIAARAYFPIWRAALILACCDTGYLGEAADRLAALLADTDDLATLPPHGWAVPTLALLTECCPALSAAGAGADVPALAGRLSALLAPHAGEVVLAGWPAVLLSPVSRYTGILAMTAGDYERAAADFDLALPVVGDARAQVTRLRLDKARALILSGRADARDAATLLLTQARDEAGRLGMPRVAEDAQALLKDQ